MEAIFLLNKMDNRFNELTGIFAYQKNPQIIRMNWAVLDGYKKVSRFDDRPGIISIGGFIHVKTPSTRVKQYFSALVVTGMKLILFNYKYKKHLKVWNTYYL